MVNATISDIPNVTDALSKSRGLLIVLAIVIGLIFLLQLVKWFFKTNKSINEKSQVIDLLKKSR